MKLYVMVSKDEYQLPEYVTHSVAEMSIKSGKSINTIMSTLSKWKKGTIKKPWIIEVEVEED